MKKGIGKGGMQTSGLNDLIYCKKCNKPAFRLERDVDENLIPRETYYHFAPKGVVIHTVRKENGHE